MSNATKPGCKAPPSFFTRSALVIEGYATGAIALLFVSLAYGSESVEGEALFVVGIVALTVFWLWSLVEMARGLVVGEPLGLSLLAITGCFLVAGTPFAVLFWCLATERPVHWSIEWLMPWFICVLQHSFLIALIALALFLTVIVVRRHKKLGSIPAAWPTRRANHYWILHSVVIAFLLSSLGLPFILYTFACLRLKGNARGWAKPNETCGVKFYDDIISETPDYVKNGVHDILATTPALLPWRNKIVLFGALPVSRVSLYLEYNDKNLCWFAWSSTMREAPALAIKRALEIGLRERGAPKAVLENAGSFLGFHGSLEDVRSVLEVTRSSKPEFYERVVTGMACRYDRAAFVDELFELVSSGRWFDPTILRALAFHLPSERIKDLWIRFYRDSDLVHTRAFACALCRIEDEDLYEELTGVYMGHPDALVRRATIEAGQCYHPLHPKSSEATKRWIVRLMVLVDDEDGVVSRAACYVLRDMLKAQANIRLPRSLDESFPSWTATEVVEREKVRAAAREWLKKEESPKVSGTRDG